MRLGSHTVLALYDNESCTIWYCTAIVDVKAAALSHLTSCC